MYTKHIDFWKHQKQLIKAIFLSTLIIFAVVSIGKLSDEISRAFIIMLGITSLGFYSVFRTKFIKFLHKKDIGLLNTVVINETNNLNKIKSSFDKDNFASFKILKYIDCNKSSFIEKVSLIYIIPDMKEIPILNSELEDFNLGNLLFFSFKSIPSFFMYNSVFLCIIS